MITAAMLPALLGRPVAYQPSLTLLPGVSVQAAIFLSQALFLGNTPTAQKRGGWFWKEQQGDCDSWEAETGMSAKQQVTARRQLVAIGVLEEKRQGVPAKTWYRVDCERLAQLLAEALDPEEAPASPHGQPDSPNGRNCNLPTGETRDAQPECTESPDGSFLTETTTEKTPSLSGAGEGSNESIFEQAARRTDDGQPLPTTERHHPMTLDWQPDAQLFAAQCQRRGLPAGTEYTTADLADFTAHFADQPKRMSDAAWTNRFARWVHENRQRQQPAQPQQSATGGARHGSRQQRTPARHRTAQEARAAARAAAAGGEGGDVFDGDWTPGH